MEYKPVEGYLHKWTNYIKGYQKRYFVLQDGLLSYYRNTEEISKICRGTININNAKIGITDNNCFVISQSNIQTLHLRASSEADLNRWIKAISASQNKAKDLRKGFAVNDSEMEPVESINSSLTILRLQLDEMKSTNDILNKKFDDVLKSVQDMEKDKVLLNNPDSFMKLRTVKERATICRVTLAKAIGTYTSYSSSLNKESEKWLKSIERERDQKQRLENMVEQLGKQFGNLEKNIQQKNKINVIISAEKLDTDGSDDDFYDAFENQENIFNVTLPSADLNVATVHQDNDLSLEYESDGDEMLSEGSDMDEDNCDTPPIPSPQPLTSPSAAQTRGDTKSKASSYRDAHQAKSRSLPRSREARVVSSKGGLHIKAKNRVMTVSSNNAQTSITGASVTQSSTKNGNSMISLVIFDPIPTRPRKSRRNIIPTKPNISMHLWSIVKNNIGKDLSKIPMPVNFSEPISMLQRLAEDFEYSRILDRAATFQNPIDQLPYIAAFTVSSYAATALRVNKPFNPMLGETYEFDRTDDLGWRLVAEQLRHHPPECAVHCESDEWKCWFNFSMTNKFRGKYLQINPVGKTHLVFKKTKCHYTWEKVPMIIHNIIVGKVWIDNNGEIDIINCTNGDKCHLSYKPYSMFSADVPRRVTGAITNKTDQVYYVLNGTWDEKLEAKKVLANTTTSKGKTVLETEETSTLLWQRTPLLNDAEKVYFFTLFSLALNELDDRIAPTDSRFRPDQRLMEQGHWEEANKEKTRLEEEQRNRKIEVIRPDGTRDMEYEYTPLWFDKLIDPDTNTETTFFNGKYWLAKEAGDWSMCNKIF